MSNYLDHINSPADLRLLSVEQLNDLAAEIRQRIIAVTSANGGHLAPNLGVVELTLALHYVFDTPNDKLIWDVGHQCYAHKLVTGRKDSFDTLRQMGGISGFCHRDESPFDCFTTGHSSSSLSLALGMAAARDLQGEQHKVVAVIGDGALSGGMAFEALNNAGDSKTPLLVVLNDNKMSINGNVGALHSYLSRLRSDPKYGRAKENVRGFLERLPLIGPPIARFIKRCKNQLKAMLVPGMFFEELGFTYLGPTDGHNIEELIDIFRRASEIRKPVLIHTLTVKGKGYPPAEKQPHFWHGVDPFYVSTGKPRSQCHNPSFTKAFGDELCKMAASDPAITAITAAMTDGTGLTEFQEKYPRRFFDVGIAEQHAAAFASGLANGGKRPILAVYSSFLQRAYDQLIEDICLQKQPVILALDHAGIVGSDGCTHQGAFDLVYLRSIPNFQVLAPADPEELRLMLRYAAEQNAPVAIRYPKCGAAVEQMPEKIRLGKGVILRDGADAAIFALGALVPQALQAAELLQKEGISVRVINARFAAPIDKDLLLRSSAECGGRILTLEDGIVSGGFGEGCLDLLQDELVSTLCLGLPKAFIPHGSRDQLLHQLGLDSEGIADSIRKKWFEDKQ